jgi:drug/metabolite transporter (DMT)-like permease
VPIGLLDTGANVSYGLGLAGAYVAIVAVLSSLFSAVTVLLAWVVLRERLALNQWLGVLLILVGVALVSLPSA